MSKKFLPLAGIAAVLAIVSFLVLSFLFPHKKEVLVDTRVKPEEVFKAQLNEAEAQPTATTAESSELGSTPPVETVSTDTASEPVAELPVEASTEPVAEAPIEAPVEPSTETAVEAPVDAPVEVAAEPAATPEPTATTQPAAAAPASGGLSRDQLAKIVAEAAAKAAAETAKSIAEQAVREAASN